MENFTQQIMFDTRNWDFIPEGSHNVKRCYQPYLEYSTVITAGKTPPDQSEDNSGGFPKEIHLFC